MNIAILTPTFSYFSGIDRVVQQQAEEYTKKGHSVTVIALEAKIKSKKYKVVSLGLPKGAFKQRLYRLFFFLDRQRMAYYKKLRQYDKVICHFYPLTWLGHKAKKQYDLTYVYHNHGVNTTAVDGILEKVYMMLFQWLTNITIKNVDEAYSVSKYLQKDLKKVSGISSKVCYNIIDSKRFNKNAKPKDVRKKLGLTKDHQMLLYVGRIAPHKGVHYVIEAVNKLQQSHPNIRFVVVGKPTFAAYLQKLKHLGSDQTLFAGFVPDEELAHYYAACDVYVTGSLWEGFDLPVVEAQACGKPVVAFDIGSHPEVVKKGKNVKAKDTTAFAKAIATVLKK